MIHKYRRRAQTVTAFEYNGTNGAGVAQWLRNFGVSMLTSDDGGYTKLHDAAGREYPSGYAVQGGTRDPFFLSSDEFWDNYEEVDEPA